MIDKNNNCTKYESNLINPNLAEFSAFRLFKAKLEKHYMYHQEQQMNVLAGC